VQGLATDIAYAYDGARMRQETFSATGQSLGFAYLDSGQRQFFQTPERRWESHYDSSGQLTRVTNADYLDMPLATLYYDSVGRLTRRDSHTGAAAAVYLSASYDYDATGRLTRIHNQGYDSGGTPQDEAAIAYMFDDAGGVTKVLLDDSPSQYIAYQYDLGDRLTREQRSGTSFDYTDQYWYDAAGNRTRHAYTQGGSTETTSYYYDSNYRLTRTNKDGTDTVYGWDAAGNLTSKAETGGDAWEYLWDARDKMTKVRKQPSGGSMADVAAYSYDALGRRFQKTANGAARTYCQDGLTPIYESTASATKAHRSIPGAIGNVVTTADYASGYSFYAYDRLGNVLAAFGADGRIAKSPVMDAFGNVLSGDRADFGITTKQFDEDAELYYFNARRYESNLGIFISEAPLPIYIEHSFVFCRMNPVNNIDPLGMINSMSDCKLALASAELAWLFVLASCFAALGTGGGAGPACYIAWEGFVAANAAAAAICANTIPIQTCPLPMPCAGFTRGAGREDCCQEYCWEVHSKSGNELSGYVPCVKACVNGWNKL